MGENRVFSKCWLGFGVMQLSLSYFVTDFLNCLVDSELRKDKSIFAITSSLFNLYAVVKFIKCVKHVYQTASIR